MMLVVVGKSGAGKTYVAKRICERHGHEYVSTGDVCRSICLTLFGEESKKRLNLLGSKLRELDNNIWIDAALRGVKDGSVVFDSARYKSDILELRKRGYKFVEIVSNEATNKRRMRDRNQLFDDEDLRHETETAFDNEFFDFQIVNDGSFDVEKQIDDMMLKHDNRSRY